MPVVFALLIGLLSVGCAGLWQPRPRGPADLMEAADLAADAERRASIRLAAQAEDARLRGEPATAQVLAESALRLDGRNPYAYLVLARALADAGDRESALEAATEAETRFLAEEPSNTLWRGTAARLREELAGSVAPAPGGPPGPPGRRLDPVLESGR